LNNSSEQFNQYYFELFDGDNDTCLLELMNFLEIFHLQSIARNQFLLYAHILPEREYYILQFRLHDLINETMDQPCIRDIQLVLTIGTNETNQTVAIDTARDYLEALHLISQRSHSYFDLSLLHVILLFILLSIAIFISIISMKLIFCSSIFRHRKKRGTNPNTLYRLQGPTDTQLPLLDHGPGEQSFTSSSMIPGNQRLTAGENYAEQQQQQVKKGQMVPIENEKNCHLVHM
jgi:hypothetical protein